MVTYIPCTEASKKKKNYKMIRRKARRFYRLVQYTYSVIAPKTSVGAASSSCGFYFCFQFVYRRRGDGFSTGTTAPHSAGS